MEFIDLHSIFKDNLVISSISNYFNNTETPIICYKYNKPIRPAIFNFKDNLVISFISNYFNNTETPIICYKYNKPIRPAIFNFNKIVTDINIDSNTPEIVKFLIIYIPLQAM